MMKEHHEKEIQNAKNLAEEEKETIRVQYEEQLKQLRDLLNSKETEYPHETIK